MKRSNLFPFTLCSTDAHQVLITLLNSFNTAICCLYKVCRGDSSRRHKKYQSLSKYSNIPL